ncbi:MAG: HD domain-containing protein [Bacilli bacterium]|nr:HD domain-containing protein [Bacilli bacterium]
MNLFEEYVKGYDFGNKKIEVKYRHTLRVKVLCELIAKDLGLDKEQIKLASLCGVFHDIARFEQVKRFDSFDDYTTIDHGDLGYEIFLNEFADKLDLSEKDKMIIAKSIKYHNKHKVENVNEEELLFTNIVRDADKIDIMYIYANVPGMIADGEGEITDDIREVFYSHKSIERKTADCSRETVVLALAFIWDINFDCSYKIIKENKYYDKIKKILNNSVYDEFFEEINKFLKEK